MALHGNYMFILVIMYVIPLFIYLFIYLLIHCTFALTSTENRKCVYISATLNAQERTGGLTHMYSATMYDPFHTNPINIPENKVA